MYLQDYGTLSCWASNEVGTQQHPCLFQVVLAGKFSGTGENRTPFNGPQSVVMRGYHIAHASTFRVVGY